MDDDGICPKGKPGESDFSPDAAEIYWYWRLCNNLDDHPNDMWYKRWKRLLDGLVKDIERKRIAREREQARMEREQLRNRVDRY